MLVTAMVFMGRPNNIHDHGSYRQGSVEKRHLSAVEVRTTLIGYLVIQLDDQVSLRPKLTLVLDRES